MARVSFVAEEDASPEVRGVYARQHAHLGQVLTTTRVRAHCPELLLGIEALLAGQERSEAAPAATKTLVTLLVSRLNGCAH